MASLSGFVSVPPLPPLTMAGSEAASGNGKTFGSEYLIPSVGRTEGIC
jgi:hypothetical protein